MRSRIVSGFAGLVLFWSVQGLAFAQIAPENTLLVQGGCAFSGQARSGEVVVTPASRGASEAIDMITSYSGLPPGFNVYSSEGFDNAVATIIEGQRIILYDPNLIAAIKNRTNSYWSAVSILAHEVGHHLAGHTLPKGGAGHKAELEADYFSGFILFKLGASLEDGQGAFKVFANLDDSATHPGLVRRLNAVENGWRTAAAQKDRSATPPTPPDIEPTERGYPIFREEDIYAEGAPRLLGCGHYEEYKIFTVYSATHQVDNSYVVLEDATGYRDRYSLDVRNLSMALRSWRSTIMEPGRRVKVLYSVCGSGGFLHIRYIEPLRAGTD